VNSDGSDGSDGSDAPRSTADRPARRRRAGGVTAATGSAADHRDL